MIHYRTFSLLPLAALSLASAAYATTAYASEDASVNDKPLSVGIGVYSQRKPYGNIATSVVPLLNYENRYVRIGGATADLKLPWVSTNNLSVSLRALYALGDGYKASDEDVLHGMEERKGSVWGGPALNWHNDVADISLDWLTDLSHHSGGHKLRLEVSKSLRWQRFQFTPRVGGTWLDGDTVDYYYGVRPSEATATRPAYIGSSTFNVEAGLRTVYLLAPQHRLMLDVGITLGGKGIKDSPITEKRVVPSVGVGYAYQF